MQTAPFIKVSNGIQEWFKRDPEQLGWRDISETGAGHDDKGGAEYLLHCELLANPPRR